MAHRMELQNKGQGYRKNPSTGEAMGPGTSHKGVSRTIKANKRTEAEERNEKTVPDKRRAFWRERGFNRQSQAAALVAGTVADVNTRAKEQRQRAEDWPLLNSAI